MPNSRTRQRLAIVGASVRSAALSAVQAGFEVVAADRFADADLDSICPITKIPSEDYPQGLASWLAQQRVDAWMYTGALENYPELIDQMAAIAPLWGVRGEPLRRCRDPLVLQQVFSARGVSFPKTCRISEAPQQKTGWLAKTYRHSAGVGVSELATNAEELPCTATTAFAQQMVSGTAYSIVFAAGPQGGTCLNVSRQLVGQPHSAWAYRGSVASVSVPSIEMELVERLREALCVDLGLMGLVGVDLISDGSKTYVIEVNPRWTASMESLERCFGSNAIKAHAAIFSGTVQPDWIGPPGKVVVKEILFATSRIKIDRSACGWLAEKHRQGEVFDLPRLGESIETGHPVCTLIANASDESTAMALLDQIKEQAKSVLAID